MIPDVTIPGFWIQWFLIYWGVCYVAYFLIAWATMKVKPWDFPLIMWVSLLPRCLLLPILLPIRLIYHWLQKDDHITTMPNIELCEFTEEKTKARNEYLDTIEKIEIREDAEARKQEAESIST